MMRRPNNPTAFTLIEVMLAVVVLGLLTAAAVMTFAAPIRKAQLRQAIDLIRDVDTDARAAARNFNRPVVIEFNQTENRIDRREGSDVKASLNLPGAATIDEIRVGNAETSSIAVSSAGLSQSYAIKVKSPDDEAVWLVFAGLSGQMTRVNDESKVRQILQSR